MQVRCGIQRVHGRRVLLKNGTEAVDTVAIVFEH